MTEEILIKPWLCTGCCTCSLVCSMISRGEFRPSLAHIRVTKKDFEGIFDITISSTCRGCTMCARSCPSGALKVIEIS